MLTATTRAYEPRKASTTRAGDLDNVVVVATEERCATWRQRIPVLTMSMLSHHHLSRRSTLVLVTLLGMAAGLVAVISAGGSLSAQETPPPPPGIIQASGATGRNFDPALVDIGSALLTVYRSERQGRPHGLYYSKSMDDGISWIEDMPVSTDGSEGQPDLAKAADATLWLVYLQWVPTGSAELHEAQQRLAYRTSSPDGMNWGPENLLPYGVAADHLYRRVHSGQLLGLALA